MDSRKKKEIDSYSDADKKKWLRIDKKNEDKALKSHTNDIYKRISALKIKKEQLNFNTFDGSYEEFSRIQRRLDLLIKEEEDKLKFAEDMADLYDKEIPMCADDFDTNRGNSDELSAFDRPDTSSGYRVLYDKSEY